MLYRKGQWLTCLCRCFFLIVGHLLILQHRNNCHLPFNFIKNVLYNKPLNLLTSFKKNHICKGQDVCVPTFLSNECVLWKSTFLTCTLQYTEHISMIQSCFMMKQKLSNWVISLWARSPAQSITWYPHVHGKKLMSSISSGSMHRGHWKHNQQLLQQCQECVQLHPVTISTCTANAILFWCSKALWAVKSRAALVVFNQQEHYLVSF